MIVVIFKEKMIEAKLLKIKKKQYEKKHLKKNKRIGEGNFQM
jgi:hypothetical protein